MGLMEPGLSPVLVFMCRVSDVTGPLELMLSVVPPRHHVSQRRIHFPRL
jgi:hypothetical protein